MDKRKSHISLVMIVKNENKRLRIKSHLNLMVGRNLLPFISSQGRQLTNPLPDSGSLALYFVQNKIFTPTNFVMRFFRFNLQ